MGKEFAHGLPVPKTAWYVGWFGCTPDSHRTGWPRSSSFWQWVAAPPVDMDGISRTHQRVSCSTATTSSTGNGWCLLLTRLGCTFTPFGRPANLEEWLYKTGGPVSDDPSSIFDRYLCLTWGGSGSLSYRLGMRPGLPLPILPPVAAATSVLLVYPIGQGSFSDGLMLGVSGTFNFNDCVHR